MTLMIVDDNARVRRVIRRICRGLADAFCECANGAEALASYGAWQPDWVLMDVSLEAPEAMNGLTATRHLLAAFPAARIVVVSRFDSPEMREAAARAGACGFVAKDNLLELRALVAALEVTPHERGIPDAIS